MIRVLEAFSGMGAQHKAISRIGIDYQIVGTLEIDNTAIKAYQVLHGDVKNFGDITTINPEEIPEFDFMSYSFPCQALSLAGKREGMSKDSGTKSSLLWECDKIISYHRPKYLMMENVTQILSDAHKVDFDAWKSILKSYGYNNYVYKLMASDFGVPQRRERVFMISILKDYDYGYADSKVIEEDNFHIHHKKKNPKFKSVMDKNVDKKYYDIPGFLINNPKRPPRFFTENDSIPTLTTKMLNAWNCGFIKDANGSRYVTPLEAVRLMGFDDSDYRKLRKNFSDHQIYKLCGNSIVVNVLEVIFAQLFRKEM